MDSEGSEDEEEVELDLESVRKNKSFSRSSVSAEAYGMFHKKSDFKAKVIPKSDNQKERIKKRLEEAFMFQALDENDK